MLIAVVYHSFPHYRSGVIKKMMSDENSFVFIGSPEEREGIKNYRFHKNDEFKSSRNISAFGLLFQPRVIFECLFGDYDAYVFLANPNHLSTWLGALVCKVRSRRVIFWGHGFKSEKITIKNKIRRLFFNLADAFYSYGWIAKKNAKKLGFDEKSVYVGFNSLDYDSQLIVREKCDINFYENSDVCMKILCISRLTQICRYDILFEAASLVQKEFGIGINIKIIGDGPETSALKAQALVLGLDVDFIGALYDEEKIASFIYAADVTVSPGKVGLTAMHSMMYGTPVISHSDFESQMPEVEAVVPGFTGYLFKKNDAVDLAEKLRDFKANFPDRELTRQRCFAMIDKIYNPSKQVEILTMAIRGIPAPEGNDAFVLFNEKVSA